MNNAQTFSQASDQYAKSRPLYPIELFAYLSEVCAARDSAWDCATGNGQAAVSLANYFAHVEATDISEEQIRQGIAHPRVRYSVSPAEQTSFDDNAFDLITVATAAHWFDQEQFHREVTRVLKPRGALALWSYGFFSVDPVIDQIIQEHFLTPIDPFWAAGNRIVINGYRDLKLPFKEINPPHPFSINLEWSLQHLAAYVRTWSAVKRYITEIGSDPVETLEIKLKEAWSDPAQVREAHMPLFVRVCRKPVA